MTIRDDRFGHTKLPILTKLAFGIGSVGEVFFGGMFNTFIGIFYNQAIGLSNSLVGLAIMIALIADAISDPVVGVVSDRWRSRFGRRHPFLFFAPVPLAISIFLIFNPPASLTGASGMAENVNQMGLFIWLTCLTITSRLSITLYVIPHLALGGELTRDYNERSSLFSLNSIFAFAIGALFAFVAWGYFLAGTTVNINGETIPRHLDPDAYLPLVLTSCGVVLSTIWLSAIGTLRAATELHLPASDSPRFTLIVFYQQMVSLLKIRNYLFLIFGLFFFAIASGLYETFNVFVKTYFWELRPDDLKWFGLASAPAAVIGAVSAPRLMRIFGRKAVIIGDLCALALFVQLPVDLRLLGLLPANGSESLFTLLLVNAACFTFTIALGSVTILSMLSDTIDENELVTGLRQEGLFFAARNFVGKAASSLGHLFAGLMLDLFVRLPFNAVPGEVPADVITRLGIAAGPVMGVFAIISILFYLDYNLSRERHEAICKELDARKLSNTGTPLAEAVPETSALSQSADGKIL